MFAKGLFIYSFLHSKKPIEGLIEIKGEWQEKIMF